MSSRPSFTPSRFRAALVVIATLGLGASITAIAQITPGVPDGILNGQFQLNPHPQLQFAASAPSAKFQNRVTKDRRRADDGDASGCNLQCPDSQ